MAEQGDTRAQAWLGHRYYWGAGGVARDRVRALEYLQRAGFTTQFTCCTSTKVHILTPGARSQRRERRSRLQPWRHVCVRVNPNFTCFASAKVQTLTLTRLAGMAWTRTATPRYADVC